MVYALLEVCIMQATEAKYQSTVREQKCIHNFVEDFTIIAANLLWHCHHTIPILHHV